MPGRYACALLPVLICLFALAGCTSGQSAEEDPPPMREPDGGVVDPLCTATPEPAPPEPTDLASRLVATNAEAQRSQCDCGVQFGAYACVENCEAELFKLDPYGDEECLRELLNAIPEEEESVECQLSATEDVVECAEAASCDDTAFEECAITFEITVASCASPSPGFDPLLESCLDRPADRLVELYSESLDAAVDEACRCAQNEDQREGCLGLKKAPRADCLAPLIELDPLSASVTECLIEYFDEEIEFLAEEECCEDPGDAGFGCRSGATPGFFTQPTNTRGEPRLGCTRVPVDETVYTATGRLADTMGGDAARLDGATLTIRTQLEANASSNLELSAAGSEKALWETVTSYRVIGRPSGEPNLSFPSRTNLVAVNHFPLSPPPIPNPPPQRPYDLFGFEDSSGVIEGVEVALPSARVDFIGQGFYEGEDPPPLPPLPWTVDAFIGGSLTDASGAGAFAYDFEISSFTANPDPVVEALKAVASCMGPEPPPPFTTTDDPARCGDDVDASFLDVALSQKLDEDGKPFSFYYLVFRTAPLIDLQRVLDSDPDLPSLAILSDFFFSLALLDSGPDDRCEQSGVISILVPYQEGSPPDFGPLGSALESVQAGLESLGMLLEDAQGEVGEQAHDAAIDLARTALCPAVGTAINGIVPIKDTRSLLLNFALKATFTCL